ncbi:MAG: hypothetical protein GYB49_03615 [Alphaproteobacteria bacterium]|nr:hypothetical protein [Hyphomonas sp.]MBR9806300.1 hypothetical protein [Alphaproteobacteria bacterium]|tara:strand:- start:2338 stop:2931 length:594 start_codon:yes stop_codon:yes gene_type:complete
MTWSRAAAVALAGVGLVLLGACSPKEGGPQPVLPEDSLTHPPHERQPVVLTEAAEETRDELLSYATAGSLTRLSRKANEYEDFVSNFGGTPHREFWDLMRRTGVDPNLRLRALFDLPVGMRQIDGEIWFVWPDLAARDAHDLIPEKLTFQERRRLRELIGDDGIEKIRRGEGYPGMRTAIAGNGRWVYYVLGQDEED